MKEIEKTVCADCENRGMCNDSTIIQCGCCRFELADKLLTPYDAKTVLTKFIDSLNK